MSPTNASGPGRASSASAVLRSRTAQNTGTFVLNTHSTPRETEKQFSRTTTCASTLKGSARLPSIKAARRRSVWDTVCVPALISSQQPDLDKLRLYFKGLNLTKQQINMVHRETKWSFLHHFASQGDDDLVTWALQAGADHAATNAMGKTPLHLAAEANKTMAVLALLKAGADVHAKTLAGFTPLHLAVLNRHKVTVRSLLKNSVVPLDVMTSESVHGTPIELAKDPEIREMLLDYSFHGFFQSPTAKSRRERLRLSSSLSSSLSREVSDNGSAVPTPKSTRILLQPLLSRDLSGPSVKIPLDTSNSDRHQLRALERSLGLSCV